MCVFDIFFLFSEKNLSHKSSSYAWERRRVEKLFSVTNVEVIKVFVVLAHKIVLIADATKGAS